jgi:hypothetical protein
VYTESRWGYLNGRDKLEGVGVCGRISKRTWRNRMEWSGLGSFGSRYGQLASSNKHNIETSSSIKLGNCSSNYENISASERL